MFNRKIDGILALILTSFILILTLSPTKTFGSSHPIFLTKRANVDEKLIALTFDDGPDPRFTPKILSLLEKYDAKATFFVVGTNLESNPDLARKIIENGNEIANHTYSHPYLEKLSAERTDFQIRACEDVINQITGKSSLYFRPPRGRSNTKMIETAKAHGMETILWSICIEKHTCKTPTQMANRIVDSAFPGMIILAHDGRLNRQRTVDSLPIILKELKQKGYKFVTLEELLKAQKKSSK